MTKTNYTKLLEDCNERGWRSWMVPIEVGARGFCAQSVSRLMSAVGSTGRDRRRTLLKLRKASVLVAIFCVGGIK